MRQAAADRFPPLFADRGMRDVGDGFRQERRVPGNIRRSLQIDMACQRTRF